MDRLSLFSYIGSYALVAWGVWVGHLFSTGGRQTHIFVLDNYSFISILLVSVFMALTLLCHQYFSDKRMNLIFFGSMIGFLLSYPIWVLLYGLGVGWSAG